MNLPADLNTQVRSDRQSLGGTPKRKRNPRGQGARLTEDIVSGALSIIEREGTDDAVTLRAVAREIGIAAPSIYAHFPDRAAIMLAVVARVFDELTEAIAKARLSTFDDPVERLVAGCEAYVAFGLRNPSRYRVLFSERRPDGNESWRDYCKPVAFGPNDAPVLEFGVESFALLVDTLAECIAAGRSASTDAMTDSTAIWVALHGTVSLKSSAPGFPWPEPEDFVRQFVLRLARIRPGPSA
ncbi:MAG: TetR/AcrR family transcriptional regulator [Acidimicrobiales bacterium]|jgi:AcrR family transcriptional regulator